MLHRMRRPACAGSDGIGPPRTVPAAWSCAIVDTMGSLRYGRGQLSIPCAPSQPRRGPSVMPDRVLQAMHIPSPNIYEGEVVDITDQVLLDLCECAQTTEGTSIIIIGNGHAAWEAALVNTLSEGDRALVISTGTFATAWGAIAESVGVTVDTLEFGMMRAADPAVITEYLCRPESAGIKAVMVCQTDTASSCNNDIAAIRAAIDAANHPALYMVDCVASFACEEMRMDEWGVDCIIAGSQKGLMVPAGLGFNILSPKAKAAREGLPGRVSAYWDWLPRIDPEVFYFRFAGTLPTHHLYGLRTALDMILREEGIENVWARHRTLAAAVHAAVECWGSAGGVLRANIAEPSERSVAVTTVTAPGYDMSKLRKWTEEHAGLTLGVAITANTELGSEHYLGGKSVFRIGHMGHLNPPMLLGALATIDAGLQALGIPHGKGALEAAAAVIGASGGPGAVGQIDGGAMMDRARGVGVDMVKVCGKL